MSESLEEENQRLQRVCRDWGRYASDLSCENIVLRKRIEELESAIISGGAIIPDAHPHYDNLRKDSEIELRRTEVELLRNQVQYLEYKLDEELRKRGVL